MYTLKNLNVKFMSNISALACINVIVRFRIPGTNYLTSNFWLTASEGSVLNIWLQGRNIAVKGVAG